MLKMSCNIYLFRHEKNNKENEQLESAKQYEMEERNTILSWETFGTDQIKMQTGGKEIIQDCFLIVLDEKKTSWKQRQWFKFRFSPLYHFDVPLGETLQAAYQSLC